jgi:hypothetical protein
MNLNNFIWIEALLYLVPIKSYSKNTLSPSFLEWTVETNKNKHHSTSPEHFLIFSLIKISRIEQTTA